MRKKFKLSDYESNGIYIIVKRSNRDSNKTCTGKVMIENTHRGFKTGDTVIYDQYDSKYIKLGVEAYEIIPYNCIILKKKDKQ